MTRRAQIKLLPDGAGAPPGFALMNDRAGRFVDASLRSSPQSGVRCGAAVERRSWGNLVWRRKFVAEPPTVSCVAVITPGLTGPRRFLARRGLPTLTIHGLAGYPFAYPVTFGVLVAGTMLLAAVIAWFGGSRVWQGALVAAIAPAAWESVGVFIRDRSGLVRRVDDPAHLSVLGRVEGALRTLCRGQAGPPHLASTVEQIWWAAAASRQSASLVAEDLEALVRHRAGDRPSTSGGEQPAYPVPLGAPHRSIAELWDRYYRVVDEHRLYETDIEKILTAPQLSDLSNPVTAAFITALVEAQDALQGVEGVTTADSATVAVQRLEVSWVAAQQAAEQARLSGFAADEQASLRRASGLIKHALPTALHRLSDKTAIATR